MSFINTPRYRWYCAACDLHHIRRILWPLSKMRCSACMGEAVLKLFKKRAKKPSKSKAKPKKTEE